MHPWKTPLGPLWSPCPSQMSYSTGIWRLELEHNLSQNTQDSTRLEQADWEWNGKSSCNSKKKQYYLFCEAVWWPNGVCPAQQLDNLANWKTQILLLNGNAEAICKTDSIMTKSVYWSVYGRDWKNSQETLTELGPGRHLTAENTACRSKNEWGSSFKKTLINIVADYVYKYTRNTSFLADV